MGSRTLLFSDLSGEDLTDESHARIRIKHPDFNFPVELDITTDEAGKFVGSTLRFMECTIYEPNQPPRSVFIETKQADKLFPSVDWQSVLESARKAEVEAQAPRRGRPPKSATTKAAAPKSDERIDYTAADKYGQLHRGRVTDEESRLVRENRDQASRNREAQGHPAIDWNDPKEKARYKLD